MRSRPNLYENCVRKKKQKTLIWYLFGFLHCSLQPPPPPPHDVLSLCLESRSLTYADVMCNTSNRMFVSSSNSSTLITRRHLIIIRLIRRLAHDDPPIFAVLVLLVLQGQFAQMADDVLHLGVVQTAVLATQVGERGDLVEQEIGDGEEDQDADGIGPDDDDCDDAGVAVLCLDEVIHWVRERALVDVRVEPAENAEQGSDSVDAADGTDELPRGESVGAAGDEDEPVLGQGNFEEENFLDVAPVLDDTAVGQVHAAANDPGADGEFNAEDDRDDPNLGELPFDGTGFRVSVVVGNGDRGQIGEQGNEDDEFGRDGLVDDDHRRDEVDLQMQTEGDTVLNVGLHTLENLTSRLDGEHDSAKTGGEEHDVGSGLSGFRSAFDGDTAIGLLERRSIVDTCDEIEISDERNQAELDDNKNSPSPVMAVKWPRCCNISTT